MTITDTIIIPMLSSIAGNDYMTMFALIVKATIRIMVSAPNCWSKLSHKLMFNNMQNFQITTFQNKQIWRQRAKRRDGEKHSVHFHLTRNKLFAGEKNCFYHEKSIEALCVIVGQLNLE